MATSTSETPIADIPFTRDKVVLDAWNIRRLCPQFRILVIGKANAGKTTLLRKVCLASPDVEPTVRDKEGNVIDFPKDGAKEDVAMDETGAEVENVEGTEQQKNKIVKVVCTNLWLVYSNR